jgi:hypothetical protein
MIGQEDGMFMFLSKKLKREQGSPLNEAQRALVEKKFEILRQASFGFTHDRLLHIQEEDLKGWTDACTGELRRKITLAAPSHIKIVLIDFRNLRCVSLQCLPLRMHADGARLADGLGPAPAPSISKEGSRLRVSSLFRRAARSLFRYAERLLRSPTWRRPSRTI